MGIPPEYKDTKTFTMIAGLDTNGDAKSLTMDHKTSGILLANVRDAVWHDKRYDYSSGDLDYSGFAEESGADTGTGSLWTIWKYTWSGGNLVRSQGPVFGNWDDRATLF